jgi:hypothetical protein
MRRITRQHTWKIQKILPLTIELYSEKTCVRFQVVPRPQIVNPCRLIRYRDFLLAVDEFVDESAT